VLIAEASGAQVESLWLTVYDDGNRVNIGYPTAVGPALGVAYIMTELG